MPIYDFGATYIQISYIKVALVYPPRRLHMAVKDIDTPSYVHTMYV